MMYLFFICTIFFLLSLFQSLKLNKSPPDHNAHIFIINEIQKKNYGLPSAPISIINKSSWGGYPIIYHYLISKFSSRFNKYFSLIQSPILTIIICTIIVHLMGYESKSKEIIFFLILFSPFNFDINNAKNYGFSCRTLGQLFLILFIVSLFKFIPSDYIIEDNIVYFSLAFFSAMGIIMFNVFALQALLIFCFISLLFGSWMPLIILILALLTFIILFGEYGKQYIVSTVRYWNSYRKYFAKISILKLYPSFWLTPFIELKSVIQTRNYKRIYNLITHNSVINVFLFNPIVLLMPYLLYQNDIDNNVVYHLSVAMFFAFFVTSIKPGRFWGEPHRYLELLTPFVIVFGFNHIEKIDYYFICYMILANSIQIYFFTKQVSIRLDKNEKCLNNILNIIVKKVVKPVVLSNNSHTIRYFMSQNWRFIVPWSIDEKIAGMWADELYTRFPFIDNKPLLKIIDEFRPNVLILSNRNQYKKSEILKRKYTLQHKEDEFQIFIISKDTS